MKNKSLAGFSALKKQENGREVIEQILNMGQPRFAGALHAGFEERISYGNPTELDFDETDSFTIECWVKINELDEEGSMSSILYKGSTPNSFGICITDSIRAGVRGDGQPRSDIGVDLVEKEWFFVSFIFTPTSISLYYNGELVDTISDPLNGIDGTFANNGDWRSLHTNAIGGVGREVDGEICQVRFWNRALSGSEIRANMFRRLKGDEQGLVGYYPLDSSDGIGLEGLWRFDEGSGDTAFDATSNNDGTIIGNPQRVKGVSAGALRLDGIEDWVDLTELDDSYFIDEATFLMWIKLDSNVPQDSDQSGIIALQAESTAISHYPFTDGNIYLSTFRDNRLQLSASASDFDRTKWHHLAITTKPGPNNYRVFINGELIQSFTGQSQVYADTGLEIGRSSSSRYLQGVIDEPRIYNRALTETEIKLLYLNPASISIEPVRDLTENQNHGSVVGDVTVAVPFNPLFTGDGRPELHQEKIAVEEGKENLLEHPNKFNEEEWTKERCSVSVVGSYGNFVLWEIKSNGFTDTNAFIRQGFSAPADSNRTNTFIAKAGTHSRIQISFGSNQNATSSAVIIELLNGEIISTVSDNRCVLESVEVTPLGDEFYKVSVRSSAGTADPSDSAIRRNNFTVGIVKSDATQATGNVSINFDSNGDETFYLAVTQSEIGLYDTLFILPEFGSGGVTERPEPKVLLPDTLPEQGHIHIKCDTINADQILFTNESNALAIDDNYLSGKLLGNPFGSLPIGTDADLYDRIQFQVILTWDEGGGNVFFKVDGQVTEFPLSITQVEDLDPNVFLGANADGEGQESCYFDILRTGEQRLTLQEAKNLMEL